MKVASRENIRFTDKRLALGLFITVPWLLLHSLGFTDLHRSFLAVPAMLAGLSGIACVIWAAIGRTEQCLFMLLTAVISLAVTVIPLICVVP